MSLATSHTENAPGGARANSAPAAVAVALWSGAEHVCSAANAAFCGLVGRSERELLGKPVREVFVATPALWSALDRVSGSGEAGVFRLAPAHGEAADPSESGLDLQLEPQRSARGVVEGVMLVAVPMPGAARSPGVESAEGGDLDPDREHRLALALEAGKMGTWEWRIQENRVIWSPAIERMHAIPVGSFPGTFEAYQSDIHPEDRDYVLGSVQKLLAERGAHELEYRIILPDGSLRWLRAHGRLVLDAAGTPVRLVGVCRDVTEEKDSERARERAAAAEAASVEAERARQVLAVILDSITDPFAVMDEELRLTFVNAAALRFRGVAPEDMLGRRPWELAPIAQDGSFARAYRQVLEQQAPLVVEDYFPAWGRWLEASVYPLERGITVYTRDISAKKKAEQLRERLAAQAALRADVSHALASAREPRAVLSLCCQALVRHLGVAVACVWTLEEPADSLQLQASAGQYAQLEVVQHSVAVGQTEVGRVALDRAPHLTNDIAQDFRGSERQWAEAEGLSAFAGYPLLVDERLVGVLAVFAKEPLTEDTWAALAAAADTLGQGLMRRRTELALEERVKELARSNAELEQFAYVASHDLQEPLRMVASYNQLLARRYKGKLDSDADDFIGFTVEGVTRMQRLINDLLAYSRVGSRGRELSSVDTEVALGAALAGLSRAIEEAGAQVTHGPLPRLNADEGQLVQLFQNLVGNAIKFHGDKRPEVSVEARLEGESWVFSVRDNGIGIDPAYFDRIFVIFQRLHARELYPGTGIGLAICKKIVERHAGKIWVESRPGEGTTLSFSLPSAAGSAAQHLPTPYPEPPGSAHPATASAVVVPLHPNVPHLAPRKNS